EVRRVGIEAWSNIGLCHPGCQVTADAERRIVSSAGDDSRRILEIGSVSRACAHADGALPQLLDDCQYDLGVVVIGADVVNTRADVHDAADRQCRESTRNDKTRFRYAAHLLNDYRSDHAGVNRTRKVI